MISKRKATIKKSNSGSEQTLLCGTMEGQNLAPDSPTVFDAICGLKEKVLELRDQSQATERFHRLSFSIMALEKSVDERHLRYIKLDHAPGIRHFIDRLHTELVHLRDQSGPTLSSVTLQPIQIPHATAPVDTLVVGMDRQTALPGDQLYDSIQEILATSRMLKKNADAENRKLTASTAAHYSAIQRLSERMGRIEDLLLAIRSSKSDSPVLDEAPFRKPAEQAHIDPRPLLAAARAAAARALTDVKKTEIQQQSDRPGEISGKRSEATGLQPLAHGSKANRFWKSIFAAA